MGLLSTPPFNPRTAISAALWLILLLPCKAAAQQLATSVPILLPSAVAFDANGNLYIAETSRHVIRKVDASGRITTVAGTGSQGFDGDGGQATSALLDSPEGLAISASDLYIADTHNHRVRKVNLGSGVITTVGGGSTAGATGDNGPATAATLSRPVALALDATGDLFIADSGSHRVRRIDAASGVITTIAGVGTQGDGGDKAEAVAALLDSPQGIAVDANGNLYIADTHNHCIRRVDAVTGVITTIVGTGAFGFAGDAGPSASAKLALPRGLFVDPQGNIYFADSANHRIRRIDAATNVITTVVGDGTQGFEGDGAAPQSASLDSPRSTALSPSACVTFSDAGNQRIRQLSGSNVQTIAGLGSLVPGTITVSGPDMTSYGSGQVTATINSATSATGTMTFLDQSEGGSKILAQAAILQNAAVLDLSHLQAGLHTLVASYNGDASHAAAASAPFSVTVAPLPLTVVLSPSSLNYGEPVPTLIGSLNGVLESDRSNLSAAYIANLGILPTVGTYPVTVMLNGPSALSYIVPVAPTMTITRAATITTLNATTASLATANSVDANQPVLLNVHVASTTSGHPGGTVIISDGATLLTAGSPNASGDLNFVTSSLSVGPHNLVAIYSGDANFQTSQSPSALFLVNTPASGPVDFTVAPSSATTQTILSGSSADFSFVLNVQGSLSSPVTLSASGLPDLATASFNPGSIVPGTSSGRFTMTIATPKTTAFAHKKKTVAFALLFFPLLGIAGRTKSRRTLMFVVLVCSSSLTLLSGCGDRVRTGTDIPATTKSYTITVAGTTIGNDGSVLRHTANVTLIVQFAN
jgi:sugar lactone lactonase YvrE